MSEQIDSTYNTGKYIFTTKVGITLAITPPTLTARNMLMIEAGTRFPDPNPDDFARETGTKTLSGKPAMTDGRESTDYKTALAILNIQRREFVETALISSFVMTPGCDRQWVIGNYAEELRNYREYATSVPADDWEATLKLFLLDQDEILLLRDALNKNLPLTQEELAFGRKFFRVELPGTDVRGTDAAPESPGAGAAQPRPDGKPDARSRRRK